MGLDLFKSILIIDNEYIAEYAINAGVSIIMIDLEKLGKKERQSHLDSVLSVSNIDLITKVKNMIPNIDLLVRIDPLNSDSADQINEVIDRGASSIMVPMFRNLEDLAKIYEIVKERVGILPLFETQSAVDELSDIITKLRPSRVHFGLNDLSIDRQDTWMFSPLARGILDDSSRYLREKNIQFGIGGIARVSEGLIPPRLILAKHILLGSNAFILSRTFHRNAKSEADLKSTNFKPELAKLRKEFRDLSELAYPALRDLINLFEKKNYEIEQSIKVEKNYHDLNAVRNETIKR